MNGEWDVYKMGADGQEFKISGMSGPREWVQGWAIKSWGPLVYLKPRA